MRPIDADKFKLILIDKLETNKKMVEIFEELNLANKVYLFKGKVKTIEDIIEKFDNQPTVNEWIPFNENNLPEDYINAVVKISSKTKRICTYNVERKCWVDDIDGDIYEISEALEYIPLPEGYKGE